jgi:hypothetical protein
VTTPQPRASLQLKSQNYRVHSVDTGHGTGPMSTSSALIATNLPEPELVDRRDTRYWIKLRFQVGPIVQQPPEP